MDAFDVENVWQESRGRGVTVAVVDTGVRGSHPDLKGQLVKGKDVTNGSNPQLDVNGHGTRMASLIAGRGHGPGNADGVMGLAPEAKIMPIRASDGEMGGFDERRWADGVRYAVDHGAEVINLSFVDDAARPGSPGAQAIAYAQENDVIVVAGVGNDGIDELEYPAKLPGVVRVGAIDESQNLWENSNYGSGITLIAPGENIVAADHTVPEEYSSASGTSDSSAFVSATAALVRSKFPDLTAGQVINRLIKSTTFLDHKVDKVPDEKFGYGMIRPNKALRMDIPAGPKAGPLPQAPAEKESAAPETQGGQDSASAAQKDSDSTSGAWPLIIGSAVAALLACAIIIAIVLSRRRSS
ncbi:type VII secretion-associated serine protease mycosin [Streptomyces sp. NPDC002851]